MPLSERMYNCNKYGLSTDRDINAAINILDRLPQDMREVTPPEILLLLREICGKQCR